MEFFLESHGDDRAVLAMEPKAEESKLAYERTEGRVLKVRPIKITDGEDSRR